MTRKRNILIFLVLIIIVSCGKGPTTPSLPQYNSYNLKITYYRVNFYEDKSDWVTVGLHFATPYGDGTFLYFEAPEGSLVQIDKLTFEAIAEAVPSNDYPGAKKHYLWAVDPSCFDGTQSSMVVGNDFYLEGPRNRIKLTHVVPNTFHSYGGKMAEFILKKDGTLIDE